MLMVLEGEVNGQTSPRIYAENQSNIGNDFLGSYKVTDPHKALGANSSSTEYANLFTSVVINLTSVTAWEQIKFNTITTRPALSPGTPTYIKIGGKGGTLPQSLLGLLAGGNIQASVYNGATSATNNYGTPIGTAPTVNNFTEGSTNYLSVKSNSVYNSVRVSLVAPLLLGESELYLYHAFYIPAPTVTGTPATPICSGTQINLGISPTNTLLQYNWYSSDGTFLSTGNTFSPSPTSATTATITYYVEAQEIGTSFYSARIPINVTVNPISTLSSSLTPPAVCSNNLFSYTPTSTTSGTTFTWTRALVTGINNPASSGSGPVNESLINTTALPIPVTYVYTSKLNTCDNSQNVIVIVNPTPGLASIPNQTICLGQSIDLATLNPAITNGVTGIYSWYDAPGGMTPLTSTLLTPAVGTKTYYVRYITPSGCYAEKTVNITVNDVPALAVTTPAITIPEATSNLSLKVTTNATNVNWYTPSGSLASTGSNITITPPATVGTYIYTVIVDNGPGTCSNTANATVTVYSTTVCPPLTQRVYANDASTTSGNVTNAALAADGDPKTGSTLTSPISLLGLGAATQNLSWNTTVAAGTPVTIKFGPGVNLLGLGSGISVIPFKKNGSGITTIGNTLSMNAALLTLLPGTNMLEYTFIPLNASGVPQAYDGVKITLNALLSLGLTANIYEAYYYKTASSLDCTKDVLDVLSGAEAPLGIGTATATVNVTNPWGVVDNSGTPTVLTNTIGVGAYAKERIIFSSQSLPGDSLKIVTSVTGTILNLGLLGGFSIQRYLGSSPVGDLIAGNGSLLTLKLLDGGTKAALILAPMAEPYDAIEIRLGNVLSIFNSLNLHEIERIANTRAIGADVNNYIEVCEGTNVVLPTTSCTTFEWYDAPTGGNLVITGQTLNTTGLINTKTYYIQPVRYGCKNMPRGILTVKINKPSITLGNSPEICYGENNATLPYSALKCATNFSISWDPTAALAGFINLSGTLSGGTISIPVPAGIPPRSPAYNGFLTISNGQSVNVTYSFTVKINPSPPMPHVIIITNSQY